MRPSKFTEDQMRAALRQVSAGTPAALVCRKLGITQTTFYRWRSKFGGVALSGPREMRALREENEKLRQIVTNLLLERQSAADNGKKKK